MISKEKINLFDSTDELQQAVARDCSALIHQAVEERGIANISLSGGSTPKRIYQLLSKEDLPWSNIHWFWGDERNVNASHDQSNERMVRQTLLAHNLSPPTNVHPVPVNVESPSRGAEEYERILREHFADHAYPQWDLIFLGLGDDAHTASLFPETKALAEQERWFVHNWVEKLDTHRYTLTYPAINAARNIWFLVAGESKRDALNRVWTGPRNLNLLPSQGIQPTAWYLTRDAKPSANET